MDHHIYDRVYIIGVDGAGRFFTKAETPNIDRIFSEGAYNHDAVTAIPTISAQCWGSILHGVSPQAHRFTNGLVGDFPVSADFPYPSIFKVAREAFPDAVLCSIVGWNCINKGIIENDLGVLMGTGSDDEVCEQVCEAIRRDDPKLLFVQFDGVDEAGHRYGYGSEDYLRSITYSDALIGRIHEAAEKAGALENTLLIVTADHGGTPDGNHGDITDGELYVSYFVSGESVIPGEFGYVETRDTASITAFAFGIDQPECWSSRIPDGLFKDGISFDRRSEATPDGSKRYSGRKSFPTPEDKETSLSAFTDMSTLLCYYSFDKNIVDHASDVPAAAEGKIYYTEGFYGHAADLDDVCLTSPGISAGKNSYTFCGWFRFSDLAAESDTVHRLFAMQTQNGEPVISFSVCNGKIVNEIGFPDHLIVYERPLPANYAHNWFHFICSYDRGCDELCYYYDFTLDSDWYCTTKIPREVSLDGAVTLIGNNTSFTADDILFYDHKLSDHEIDDLQKYYEQFGK